MNQARFANRVTIRLQKLENVQTTAIGHRFGFTPIETQPIVTASSSNAERLRPETTVHALSSEKMAPRTYGEGRRTTYKPSLHDANRSYVRHLARARAASAPAAARSLAQAVRVLRWSGLISVAAQHSLATTFLAAIPAATPRTRAWRQQRGSKAPADLDPDDDETRPSHTHELGLYVLRRLRRATAWTAAPRRVSAPGCGSPAHVIAPSL